jgi:hypothetical protein
MPTPLFRRSIAVALAAALSLVAPAAAQIAADAEAPSSASPRYGEPDTIRFRVGAEITASRGAIRGVTSMMCIPINCPEQQVKILDEDFSPDVEVTYRPLPGGEVNQMLINIPHLESGATARAIVTCEVATRPILPPEETDSLKIPERVPARLRVYTNGSPYIEVKHQRIRSLSKEILKDLDPAATDWQKIEKLYDYVLENVEYVEGPDKSAMEALRDGQSDCQGRSALFVALCRANKIPARLVWVDGHVFPEFYLERGQESVDADNGAADADVASAVAVKRTARKPIDPPGDWYPCESAGTRAFGEMPLARTILQKGDNFRIPERKERGARALRYASDFTFGLPTPGGGKPKVKYIREQIVESLEPRVESQN